MNWEGHLLVVILDRYSFSQLLGQIRIKKLPERAGLSIKPSGSAFQEVRTLSGSAGENSLLLSRSLLFSGTFGRIAMPGKAGAREDTPR
jgi:hypothetical protein